MPSDTIQRIFDDLLNLEVNLIIKPEMTARKMPLTGEAFHDIATTYRNCLMHQADRLGSSLSGDDIRDDEVSGDDFVAIAHDATALRRMNAVSPLTDADGEDEGIDVVLKRIERNSEVLVRIMRQRDIEAMKRQKGTDAAPYYQWADVKLDDKEDLLLLRKAWEVGTESVVIQTVAQVDGDIVTRIQPSRAGADDAALHHVHMNMVSTSLEHWRYLFATVVTFTQGVFTSFFR